MARRTRALRGDEADLFRRYHERLKRSVARTVVASDALIEDACSFAWMQLVRDQPDRAQIFGWLRTVAVHEAYKLLQAERREALVTDLLAAIESASGNGDGGNGAELDDAIEARDALLALAQLSDRQRLYLTLFIAGFSYDEIGRLAGGRSWNHVNKHLVRARARLRRDGRQA
jgi:RNA polymerase sigma factor (sigma-70 family)